MLYVPFLMDCPNESTFGQLTLILQITPIVHVALRTFLEKGILQLVGSPPERNMTQTYEVQYSSRNQVFFQPYTVKVLVRLYQKRWR